MSRVARCLHWYHPEWCAAAVTALAWAVLLVGHRAGHDSRGLARLAVTAVVMAAAMMTPLVSAHVHAVAVSSPWRRRYRSALAFLAGFVAVWSLVGVVLAVAVVALVAVVGRPSAVGLLFALALIGHLAPSRGRRLRRCEATRPLAIRGLRADLDCASFGCATAGRCVLTCWHLMAAVTASPGLVVMAGASAVQIAERRRQPDATRTAALLVILGTVALLATLVGPVHDHPPVVAGR